MSVNYLDLFKQLPHLDDGMEVVDDWAYTPTLCHFDGRWAVNWLDEDAFSCQLFSAKTPEEAIQKAYDWCKSKDFIK